MPILRYILLSLIAVCLMSCHSDDPTPAEPSNRMILVYMAANNSLGGGRYDELDLEEMTQAAQNNGFGHNRVLVFRATRANEQILGEITPTGFKAIKTYDASVSALNPERMAEVIKDSRTLAEAHDYGLILWSHADGWIAPEPGFDATQQRSFGDDNGLRLSIPDLAAILKPWYFDFICFDCCFMANVESLYELRDCAHWVSASTIELPACGMRYEVNLPLLLKPVADVVGSAKATFDYYNGLNGSDRTCAMSVIDMTYLDQLARDTRAIYQQAANPGDDFTPQRYIAGASSRRCYLYDFGQYVRSHQDIDPALLSQWEATLAKAVVYRAATPMIWNRTPIEHHSGLSTYILNTPADVATHGYDRLQWYTDVVSTKYSQQ